MIAMARKHAQRFSDQRFHEDFNEAVGNILSAREPDKLNSPTSLTGME
jgi:alpha-1,2-mannosyltransferase